jgi:hypothetical protein
MIAHQRQGGFDASAIERFDVSPIARSDTHMSESDVIANALGFLRGHTRGDLRFEEHLRPIKYVVVPDGRLVAPVMVAMLQAVDVVLFVPDCADDVLELMVTLTALDERSADGVATDRWRIYHGDPQDVRWAFFNIDAAKFQSMVIDGDAMMVANPLAVDAAKICKRMNAENVDDLRRLCAHFANFTLEKPVMVGIDPLGLDVRAAYDVVRVPAIEPMNTPGDVDRVLNAMMKACH